jgi:uncharacterized membrane protein (DUF485 family)
MRPLSYVTCANPECRLRNRIPPHSAAHVPICGDCRWRLDRPNWRDRLHYWREQFSDFRKRRKVVLREVGLIVLVVGIQALILLLAAYLKGTFKSEALGVLALFISLALIGEYSPPESSKPPAAPAKKYPIGMQVAVWLLLMGVVAAFVYIMPPEVNERFWNAVFSPRSFPSSRYERTPAPSRPAPESVRLLP